MIYPCVDSFWPSSHSQKTWKPNPLFFIRHWYTASLEVMVLLNIINCTIKTYLLSCKLFSIPLRQTTSHTLGFNYTCFLSSNFLKVAKLFVKIKCIFFYCVVALQTDFFSLIFCHNLFSPWTQGFCTCCSPSSLSSASQQDVNSFLSKMLLFQVLCGWET